MKIYRRLLLKHRIRRTCKRFGFPSNYGETCGDKIARQLKRVEQRITKIASLDSNENVCRMSVKRRQRLIELLAERCRLLNQLFAATPAEIQRLEQVNRLLNDLTKKMHGKSVALYRQLLTTASDGRFDDDVEVKGDLQFSYNGRRSVLELENDCIYVSDFHRMICAIDRISPGHRRIIAQCRKRIDPTDHPEMTDAELGFKDKWNDDTLWAKSPFDRPDLAHLSICLALHRICSQGLYSIPDLLRMNDFCCEVTIAHRQTVEQDGAPAGWWKNCSYDVFARKLHTEADHRPPHLRYGQFIYCRTAELFPDAVRKINALADCFNDDTRVEYYLRSLYKLLQDELLQTKG